MSQKPFNRFLDFRSIIESTNDREMMESCLGLLRDLMEIEAIKESLKKKEDSLYDDVKRSFYAFFLEGLSPEEISQLADKCSGRVKILQKKEQAEKERVEKEKTDASEPAENNP